MFPNLGPSWYQAGGLGFPGFEIVGQGSWWVSWKVRFGGGSGSGRSLKGFLVGGDSEGGLLES